MPRRRPLIWICLASLTWSFSFGFGAQLITHWLRDRGAGDTLIGLNYSTHYLGLALASLGVPALMRRWGSKPAALGMFVSAASLAAFPFIDQPAAWFLCRLINGMAGAVALIPLETLVSQQYGAGQRSRAFGVYGVCLTVGGALGVWSSLHFWQAGTAWLFLVGGAAPIVGGVGLAWGLRVNVAEEVGENVPIAWGANLLSFGTAWSQGFLEGGMLAFLPLYLEALGLAPEGAGWYMAVAMAGVVLLQVPIAWLGDKTGKLRVLVLCYAVTLVALGMAPWLHVGWPLGVSLFLFGAFSGAMYPLGLALLAERSPARGLARAYAVYLAMECVGSKMGAAVSGVARDLWGEAALFGVCLAATLFAVGVGLIPLVRKVQSIPYEKDHPSAPMEKAA